MKNIVLSAACGLETAYIELFIKSLRKYYKDEIFFLVKKKDFKIKKLLKEHDCEFLEINDHKFDIQIKRYNYYLKILEKNNFKKVLICDSRDIYFQSNPFDFSHFTTILLLIPL